jgi:hypothetical protein
MRWTARAAALVLAGGIAVSGAAPAVAHGGEIDVEIGTDGAGGLTASLTWAGDGHPVEESAVVVVRAVSADGEEVGPVTLVSASEGVGWYRSDLELLDEGSWTVTARVREPEKAKVETKVDVVAPPTAEQAQSPSPSPTASEDSDAAAGPATVAAEPGTQAADVSDAAGGLDAWMIAAAAAVVVVGGGAVLLVRRRRRT